MFLDRQPPRYNGNDKTVREMLEYIAYLREQLQRQDELNKRAAATAAAVSEGE